jgi:hypothetical protein
MTYSNMKTIPQSETKIQFNRGRATLANIKDNKNLIVLKENGANAKEPSTAPKATDKKNQ